MVSFKNAAPLAALRGIKDESGRSPVIDPELIPTHLPLVYTFAERGPTLPQLVVGDSLIRTYGSKTFDYRSKFANHQTPLINAVNGEGNQMFVQRLKPADAGDPASIRLWLDIVVDEVIEYQRNADGTYFYDGNGELVEVAVSANGHRARWVLERVPEGAELGVATPQAGGLVANVDGTQSTMYPIHEFRVSSFGSYGERLGIRLSSPHVNSGVPINDNVALDQMAYLYRIAFVERPEELTTANVVETINGEQYIDFSYKEGAINTTIDAELWADNVILQGWNDPGENGIPPTVGPFSEMHVYYDYIDTILDMVHARELEYGLVGDTAADKHIFNLFNGHDLNNVPYYTYQVEGVASEGILLNENSTHYALGGSDGTMTFATFDALVANELSNFGDLEADLLDTAEYPLSVIYDTGFTLDTKKAMLTPLGRRKDLWVVLATQDVSQPQLTTSEESSVAIALRTAARMYPESEIYGTSVCRALVVGHSGHLVNSKWTNLTPLTVELAAKCARYMGAGTGIWDSTYRFDMSPANQVTMFRDVNNVFKPATTRTRDWDNGLVWVQRYDRRALFFPGLQTVYDDDSSILNSAMNMFIAVELEKVAERTWRDLTGISTLTNEQFIERSNRLIEEAVRGKFDDRVVIEADTFYTANDAQRGYSWSCNIVMYGNNMKTVGSFTIISRRREDLN